MAMAIKEPAASRKTLALIGGSLWVAVGLFLIVRAAFWLNYGRSIDYLMVGLAILLGLAKGHYVFRRIVWRNIARLVGLSPHKTKICIFAFQALTSYFIAIFMIGLGIALRMSPLPRDWLAWLYILIGVALIRGGFEYFQSFDRL